MQTAYSTSPPKTAAQAKTNIRITASTKLSRREERMVKEGTIRRARQKETEEAELRNNADSLIYTAEKTKKDLEGKITAEQTGKIDTAVTALKDALAKSDMAAVKTKSDELTKARSRHSYLSAGGSRT